MEKTIIISLGGSLIIPENVDTQFLSSFRKIILQYTKLGYRFVLICGGGKTARKYQDAYKAIAGENQEAMDWIGIEATKINAFLVKSLFGKDAHPEIIIDPTKPIKTSKKIIVAAGWKPGRSTDFDSVLLAKKFQARSVINMSNIDFVYDKDPKRFPNAKKILESSWSDFRKLIGNKWEAGLNAPFDPIAAKEAQASKISAIIIGKDLVNMQQVIEGKQFKGTIISGN